MYASTSVIVASAFFLLVWRKGFRSLHVKVGHLEAKVSAVETTSKKTADTAAKTAETVEKVNQAVNNVPPGTLPLVARVGTIETQLVELSDRMGRVERTSDWKMDAIGLIGGVLGVELPAPPSREPRLTNRGGS